LIGKHNARGFALKEVLNAKNSIGACTIPEYTNESLVKAKLGLYKIFVYLEAVAHESTILLFPPHTRIAHPGAILLHDYWTVYDSPSDLPFACYTPYNIDNNNIV